MSAIMLYGPGGSGKTTLAASMINLGYHPFFIDLDRKVRRMKNLQPYIEAKQLSWYVPPGRIIEEGLLKKFKRLTKGPKGYQGGHPIQKPHTYEQLVAIIDDLENEEPSTINEEYELVIPLPDDKRKIVPILDSLTRAQEYWKRYLLNLGGKTKFGFDEWAVTLSQLEELFDCFFGLQDEDLRGEDRYGHAIIIAHRKDNEIKQNDVVLTVEFEPLIEGSMRSKASTYVEEMYYCECVSTNRNQPAKFQVVTRPAGSIQHARTSRDIPTALEADFGVIFEGEVYDGS